MVVISNPAASKGATYSSSDGRYASSGLSTVPSDDFETGESGRSCRSSRTTPPGRSRLIDVCSTVQSVSEPVAITESVDAENEIKRFAQFLRRTPRFAAARSALSRSFLATWKLTLSRLSAGRKARASFVAVSMSDAEKSVPHARSSGIPRCCNRDNQSEKVHPRAAAELEHVAEAGPDVARHASMAWSYTRA